MSMLKVPAQQTVRVSHSDLSRKKYDETTETTKEGNPFGKSIEKIYEPWKPSSVMEQKEEE